MKQLLALLLIITTISWGVDDVDVSIDSREDTVYVDEEGNPVEELPPIEKMPEVKEFVEAVYADEAIMAGVEGSVGMQVIISDSGTVDSVSIIKGLHPMLDTSAVSAMYRFKFTPAMAGGVSIPVAIEYQYNFSLNALVEAIPEYVNFKGRLREKGTRNAIADAMVVISLPDTVKDEHIKVPFLKYLEKIGGFEGQYIEDGKLVTLTDSDGSFQFKSLPACSITVSFPVTGYNIVHSSELIEYGKQIEMDYWLRRESYDEYEIVVYGKAEKKEVAKKTLSISEIKKVPGTGGDAIKVVRALPGVARPSFVSGDIIIRGSGAEDTRFFLDGVELPRIFHFGGLRSVYSSDLISSLDMYPGGFNSRYGGAIGGIVEIKGRPAKTDRWHGNIDVNLLDAGVMLEGPVSDRLSLQASGRYSYIGKIVEEMTKNTPLVVVPYYWDLQTRLDWNINKKDKIFFTYNGSRDDLEIITGLARGGSEENSESTNTAMQKSNYHLIVMGHDRTFSKILRNELRLGLTSATENGSIFGFSTWDAENLALYFRDEIQFTPVKSLIMKGGLDVDVDRWNYHLTMMSAKGYLDSRRVMYLSKWGTYANVEYHPVKALLIKPGLRYDYYPVLEEGQPSLRFTTRWEYLQGLTIKGAAGTYSQLPAPVGQSTDDAWGNPQLPSTKAAHYVSGHEWQITDLITLDAQVYYNTQWDIPNFTDSINPVTGKNLNFFPDMEARMYGMELMLRHDQGKRFFGWISYSLSRSERRAPNAYDEGTAGVKNWDPEAWVVSQYDQTHNLQILGSWRLPRSWVTGFRFRYVTGNPMTPPLSYTNKEFSYNSDFGDYESKMGKAYSDRMEPFMQLDVRVDKKFVFQNWMLTGYLDFQNVNYFFYNSPEFYDYNYDGSERESVGAIFLPSVGITAEF